MTQVEAIYQGGVFKPLSEVALPENQKVELSIRPLSPDGVDRWLSEIADLHRSIVPQRGVFPDSALDIAQDRNRDG